MRRILKRLAHPPDKEGSDCAVSEVNPFLVRTEAGDSPTHGPAAEKDDYDGVPDMHEAASAGDVRGIRRAVAAGAFVDERDANGDTPAHLAADRGYGDAVEELCRLKADVDAADVEGRTPLGRALANGHSKMVGKFKALDADLEVPDHDGQTPMHYAAAAGLVDACKALRKAGASVGARDGKWRSPVHMAALNDQSCVLEAMWTPPPKDNPDYKGSDSNMRTRDINGDTPLHLAGARGHREVFKKLCELGAPAEAENNEGESALDLLDRAGKRGDIGDFKINRPIKGQPREERQRELDECHQRLMSIGKPPLGPR